MNQGNRRRLVFMGTPEFAVPSLVALAQNGEEVLAVFTQPDRPRGRGRRLHYSPVKEKALSFNLPLNQPRSLKDPAIQQELARLRPDLLIVVAYGQILPQAVLEIPSWGAINVHASLLPKFRGAAPIQWALIRGEDKTGVTTMRLDAGLDTGDILLQREVPIRLDDTAETLHDRLAGVGAGLLVQTLNYLRAGALVPLKQDSERATYAPPLKKEQGRLDWTLSAPELDCWVRGLTPWPGAFTHVRGQRLIIHRARPEPSQALGQPGTVFSLEGNGIRVLTGNGLLALQEVQLEGRRRMTSRDLLTGFPLSPGDRLG